LRETGWKLLLHFLVHGRHIAIRESRHHTFNRDGNDCDIT
jgi:hypothetical protein